MRASICGAVPGLSMAEWVPGCRIVYDKFHIMQYCCNDAVDEVRRAELPKRRKMRDVIKGKKWLLLNVGCGRQRGVLNRLFQLNRRVFKAYMLKESLERLWDYRYEAAMAKYLGKLDGSIVVAALASFQNLLQRRSVLHHLELLPNEMFALGWSRQSTKHSYADQPRARLSESTLPAPEVQAHCR